MELGGSMLYSQGLSENPHSELNPSIFSKIHSNTVLSYVPRLPRGVFSNTPSFCHTEYMSCPVQYFNTD